MCQIASALAGVGSGPRLPSRKRICPKAPCSFMVDTWALQGLPYHDFGVSAYTMKLHGVFGMGKLDYSKHESGKRDTGAWILR